MAGIAGMAMGTRQGALDGLSRGASMQQQREQTGMQLRAADKQQKMSGAASGAALGSMVAIGLASGPVGWGALAAGALIGGAAGYGLGFA